MQALGLGLGLAAAALIWAGPVKVSDRAQEADNQDLIAHQAVQWLKVYPLPIYKERWRLEGTVRSLERDMPRVREVFSRIGAALAGAGETAGKTRRLHYRCPKESAKRALEELRKIGVFGEPAVLQQMEPVSRAEVQTKIKALEADKAGHGQELGRMPAVAALVEELLGHLRGVEAALSKPEVDVLVHLTVREKS